MTSRPSRRASKSWGGAQRRVVRHGVQARSAATDRGGKPTGVSSRRQGDNRRGGGRDITIVIKTRSVAATGAAAASSATATGGAHPRGGGSIELQQALARQRQRGGSATGPAGTASAATGPAWAAGGTSGAAVAGVAVEQQAAEGHARQRAMQGLQPGVSLAAVGKGPEGGPAGVSTVVWK